MSGFEDTGRIVMQAIAAMRAMGVNPEADIAIIVRHDRKNVQLVGSTKESHAEQIAFLERALERLKEKTDFETIELISTKTGRPIKKGKA